MLQGESVPINAADGEEDDTPDLLASDLKDMTLFYRNYLVDKVLREAIPVEFISAKCSLDWKVSSEVSFIDMGNGSTFMKFTNEIDCNRIFVGQLRFVGGQEMEKRFQPC